MRIQIHPYSPISCDLWLEIFEMITSGHSSSPVVGFSCIAGHTIYFLGDGSDNQLVPRHNGMVHYRGNEDMTKSSIGAQDEHDEHVQSNECGNCSYERTRFVTPLGDPVEAVEVQ